jgi:hypothetical protein
MGEKSEQMDCIFSENIPRDLDNGSESSLNMVIRPGGEQLACLGHLIEAGTHYIGLALWFPEGF